MRTHCSQVFSARPQADPGCGRRATPIAANPCCGAGENPLGGGNARALLPETPTGHQAAAARRLAPCLDYLRTHLDQPITIPALSAMVGLCRSSFFELFQTATDDTPLNWFIRARMRRACELLAQTNLPIKQIAAQVGYQDPLYFSRAFKSVCGLPPTEYRTRNKRAAANVVAA